MPSTFTARNNWRRLIVAFATCKSAYPTVVDSVGDESRVFFSAWVTLEKEDGDEVEYRIVGGDEIESDSSKGYISVDSPMARALLKKEVDDEVVLDLGGNVSHFYITGIRYR